MRVVIPFALLYSMAFLDNDHLMIASGYGENFKKGVCEIDVDTGAERTLIETDEAPVLAVSRDGSHIYWGNQSLACYDVGGHAEVWRLKGAWEPVRALACTRDGTRLLAALKTDLLVLDAETGAVLTEFRGAHGGSITSIGLGPSEDSVVTTGGDGAIRIWNIRSNVEVVAYSYKISPAATSVQWTKTTSRGSTSGDHKLAR